MVVEREAEFLEALVTAHERDIAAPVIEDDLVADDKHVGFSQSRINTVRSWLFALGYLDKDEDRPDYDDTLRRALKRFQTEAGLTVDGWIGTEETWPRLRELITFDDPLLQEHWVTASGRARPALARAARTRLVLYGFGKRDDQPNLASLKKQMKRFFGVLSDLGALPTKMPTRRADQHAFILSHDDHVTAIAQGLATTTVTGLFTDIVNRDTSIDAHALLLNVTKVELWLAQVKTITLGKRYHVNIDPEGKLKIPGDLRKGMNGFFNDLADDETEVRALVKAYKRARRSKRSHEAIRLYLNATIAFGHEENPMASDEIELLHAFYEIGHARGENPATATIEALKHKRFRSRLWDGLKRVFARVKRAIAKAIRTVKIIPKVARDIAAYVYRVTSEGFYQVYLAVRSFLGHVRTAIRRVNHDDDGHIAVIRRFGRDTDVLISTTAPAGFAAAYTERLSISAQIFRWSCRVLGRLIGFGLSLVTGAIAAPALLRTLVYAVRSAAVLRRAFLEIDRLQFHYDSLTLSIEPGNP